MIVAIAIFFFLFVFFLIGWFFFQKAQKIEKGLKESFQSLSFAVMEQTQRSFLDLAKTSFEKYQESAKTDFEGRHRAIEEKLKELSSCQRELETKREGAYASLLKQIDQILLSEDLLRKETNLLAQALRTPHLRGSWGEMHLKRVVEIAGLASHCDFFEQKSFEMEGRISRPDLIIALPQERKVVIDAKTPLDAYLEASQAKEEGTRQKKLQEHAQAVRRQIKELSQKAYWKSLEKTPEYAILFLPAEAFLSGALEIDPSLIEVAAHHDIVLATPTTLIAILRSIALLWKQDGLSKNAEEMARLGQELYERIGTLTDHWTRVGKSLGQAVDAYNQSLSSLESRVLVTARKLKEVGSISSEIPPPPLLEKRIRPFLQSSTDKTK